MTSDGSEILESAIADSVSEGGSWMMTFADLLSLLLVFFIMIYAMSSVRSGDWEKVKEIMGDSFKSSKMVEERNYSTKLGITKIDIRKGTDIDYLFAVLDNKIKEDPFLRNKISIDNTGENLVVSIVNKNLFEGDTPVLSDESQLILFVIGESLQRISNKITVVGYTHKEVSAKNMDSWDLALSRATKVATQLRDMGNLSKLEAVVEKGSVVENNSAVADQVDIIIRPYTKEN